MNKSILILIISLFFASKYQLIAQIYNDKNAKEALKTIELAYLCSSITQNINYIEPREYIYKVGTTEIIGQKHIYSNKDVKYLVSSLDILNASIVGGEFNQNKVSFSWENDKLVGVKFVGPHSLNYIIDYDNLNNIIGFTDKIIYKVNIQVTIRIEYSNSKISKIIRYQDKISPKKLNNPRKLVAIKGINTYVHTDNGTQIGCLVYVSSRSNNKPSKKVANEYKVQYKKDGNNNTFSIEERYVNTPSSYTTEITYDSNDEISKKNIYNRLSTEKHIYIRKDGKIFKDIADIVIDDKNGRMEERTIIINFTASDIDSSLPEYERLKGTYKFNKAGEWIFDSRDMKYRIKENGVWSEWKFIQY